MVIVDMIFQQQKRQYVLLNESEQQIEFLGIMDQSVQNNSDVASYPMEKGGFSDFNKVQTPAELTFTLAFGDDPDKQRVAISMLERMQNSTELLTFVTPEKTWDNLTITGLTYRKISNDGVTVALNVEVSFREVRFVSVETSKITIKSAKDPGSVSTVDTGMANTKEVKRESFAFKVAGEKKK